ncbi:MAG: hypothetical protein HY033_03640 [Ignavibacteriae bacterium]|nr:hypothetical protein [Ignavibacteria bacterium]MBI3363983.1 hypothetical protein [Ignavibacteriota bacterium]
MQQLVQRPRNTRSWLFTGLAAIALAVGIVHAYSLRWVNDDAFISFRYAKNFVNGLGLVYNAGERVEGYTNFLWTMLVALGIRLELDPVLFTMILGIIFHSLTITVFVYLSWHFRRDDATHLFLPLTALALSLHRDFNVYATSGLETSMFTFLISSSFLILILGRSKMSFLATGLLFSLMLMTRPDGILFLGAALAFLLLTHKERATSCLYLLLPVAFIYVPYWLWRYTYYGFPFPNTFYAKSTSLPYYEQGFKYFVLYWKTYYVFMLIPILVFFVSGMQRSGGERIDFLRSFGKRETYEAPAARAFLLAVLYAVVWMFYVIRIGGDFMFARFLIPITPLLFFLCELLITRRFRKVPYAVLASVLLLATFLRFDQFTHLPYRNEVADEWQYYPAQSVTWSQKTGNTLRKYFHDFPMKVAFGGMMAQTVYYAEPQIAIEASAGLTDTFIAHQPIVTRGRPGHEKEAPMDYLIKRKINFMLWVNQPPENEHTLNVITFDSVKLLILTYQDSIMRKLAEYPEIKFIRIPDYIDSYIAMLDTMPREQVLQEYEFLKMYYFNQSDDRAREGIFLSRLGKSPAVSSK